MWMSIVDSRHSSIPYIIIIRYVEIISIVDVDQLIVECGIVTIYDGHSTSLM
jgi:hypothetical protein